MKKFYMIVSALMLFTFFSIDRSVQEESNRSKLDDHWQQREKESKTMCGIVITWDGKVVYENFIGFSTKNDETSTNDLSNFKMGSMHDFEIAFGLKITIFLSKDIQEFFNNVNELFTLETPPGTKLKRKLELPIDATVAKYKESR